MTLKQKLSWSGLVMLMIAGFGFFSMPRAAAVEAGATNNPTGAFNVVVAPPSIGLQTKPGIPVSTELRVQNQGLATERIKVSVMKFSANGQDGTPDLQELEPGDDFAKWIKFSTTSFTAEPNVWQTVKVTISPPADAAFGYYYAVIFSREGAEKQIQPTQANLLGAVASLVLLDVESPNAKREVNIAEFSTPRNVQEFLPVNFAVRLQNTGNVHVAARGNIVITKGKETVALLEVNLRKGYILPDTFRKFESEWIDGTPLYTVKTAGNKVVLDENGKQVQELSWDKFSASKLRMGKYNAKLVMVYDDGKSDVSTQASLSFWVIPWRILGGVALVGLFVLAGVYATIIRPARQRIKRGKFSHNRRG